jgi:hypothetical protein
MTDHSNRESWKHSHVLSSFAAVDVDVAVAAVLISEKSKSTCH